MKYFEKAFDKSEPVSPKACVAILIAMIVARFIF